LPRTPPDQEELATHIGALRHGPVEYRFQRRGPDAVVVCHGGHMRAGLALGEEVFADAGFSLLVPSRPGYGRTPVTTGGSAAGFADVVAALCDHLGLGKVAAVVGVSGGGPTAIAMAARYPALVERLILQSAVGPLPWPDQRTRLLAQVVFASRNEAATWAFVRTLFRHAPDTALRTLLRDLSTLPVRKVMAGLRPEHRTQLISLFSRMRSGHGFLNDIKDFRTASDLKHLLASVVQPGLVIASRHDGAVPFAQADALAMALRRAELVESRADSHLIWLGDDWPAIAARIQDFLRADPAG
jgi:pimeloyl-ACP methyl ester carboxylesterase